MEKEQEAIKNLTDLLKQRYEKEVTITTFNLFENIETVLSMLKQKNEEIRKRDKQIDLMADYMLSGLEDIAFNNICKQGHCVHELKDNRPTKCRKCKECIKQKFAGEK